MISFVQIDKTGTIKEATKKNLTKEILFKFCGFKKPNGFEKRATWDVSVEGNRHIIELWARDFGKAGTENKNIITLMMKAHKGIGSNLNKIKSYTDKAQLDYESSDEKLDELFEAFSKVGVFFKK